MERAGLELVEYRDVGFEEEESVYKCPRCEEGEVIRWKETTTGYKCSGWYPCEVCGFDPSHKEV